MGDSVQALKVESWRDQYGMHNDDNTLVLIEDVAKSDFKVVYSDNLTDLCTEESLVKEVLQVPHGKIASGTIDNPGMKLVITHKVKK